MSWDILSKTNLQYLLTRLKVVTDSITRGHAIKNSSGSSMTQRNGLEFSDAHVSDDSTNDKTIVDVIKETSNISNETEEGIYFDTSKPEAVIDAEQVSFDKTGTSYTSDDVDGVLNEVDDKLNGTAYTGDLNDLKITGFYAHTVTSNSNAPSDVPADSLCTLTVNAAGSLITQTLYYSSIAVYVRRFYNNSWNAWVKYSPANSAWTRLGIVTTTTPLNIGSYESFLIVPQVNGAIPFNSYIVPRLMLSYFHLSVYQNDNANWHGILNINSNNELTLRQESLGPSWNSMSISVLVK